MRDQNSAPLPIHGQFDGLETIVAALLERDPFTRGHLIHVNGMASEWAAFNLDFTQEEQQIFLQASLLHDVGKIMIHDRLLMKPGALTDEEYREIQRHAEFGEFLLGRYQPYRTLARVVGQHHEWWNGRGYPAGRRGEHIEPLARALGVLDAFSAMILDRPYHSGIREDEGLAELEICAGSQFDPYFVERFVKYRRSRRKRAKRS